MKTLLTTTAIAFALAMTNVAVASTTFSQSKTKTTASIKLEAKLTNALLVELDDFFRGEFDCGSGTSLTSLSSADMYTGMGSIMMSTIRDVV